jgi:hypothetical protein
MKTGFWPQESNNTKRLTMVLVAALLMAVQLGCGGGDGSSGDRPQTEDERQLFALVGGVSDRAANPTTSVALEQLREAFTRESAPSSADVKTYKERMFEITSPIAITGNTATFTVRVAPYDPDQGKEGQVQWKAVKEGADWKIAESPLP